MAMMDDQGYHNLGPQTRFMDAVFEWRNLDRRNVDTERC